MVGCLVSEGADLAVVEQLREAVTKEGGMLKVVAPRIGVVGGGDKGMEADFQLAGGPSVLFHAVALVVDTAGAQVLIKDAAAKAWVMDAFAHLKVIGHTHGAFSLLQAAGVQTIEAGVVSLESGVEGFVEQAKGGRIWAREKEVRQVH